MYTGYLGDRTLNGQASQIRRSVVSDMSIGSLRMLDGAKDEVSPRRRRPLPSLPFGRAISLERVRF